MVAQLQSRVDLEERRDQLAARLEDGWQRIDTAEASGADVAEWTRFWLDLLASYEETCREIDALSGISRQHVERDLMSSQPPHELDARSATPYPRSRSQS
jgi:hypothetical protein